MGEANRKGELVQTKRSGNSRFPFCECFEPEPTRRDFLAAASCTLVAALVASGINVESAPLLQFDTTRPISEQGTELFFALAGGDKVSMDPDNQIILIRQANRIMAFSLGCPHQNAALQWRSQDRRFQCPLHGAKFQADGNLQSGPATRAMDRFALRLDKGRVVVDIDKLYRSDQQKADWDSAMITLEEKTPR